MGEVPLYRGYSKLRTHTVLGPYGRSDRPFLRAVRVLNFEYPLYGRPTGLTRMDKVQGLLESKDTHRP